MQVLSLGTEMALPNDPMQAPANTAQMLELQMILSPRGQVSGGTGVAGKYLTWLTCGKLRKHGQCGASEHSLRVLRRTSSFCFQSALMSWSLLYTTSMGKLHCRLSRNTCIADWPFSSSPWKELNLDFMTLLCSITSHYLHNSTLRLIQQCHLLTAAAWVRHMQK